LASGDIAVALKITRNPGAYKTRTDLTVARVLGPIILVK